MNRRSIYKLLFSVLPIIILGCKKPSAELKKYPTAGMEYYFDLSLTNQERDSLLDDLEEYRKAYAQIHEKNLINSKTLPMIFDPVPAGYGYETKQKQINWMIDEDVQLPARREDLAFYPVHKLASLIKSKKVSAVELTKLYLDRLKTYGDTLKCVITITEEIAMRQALKADQEIAAGKYKGPLHGIPYGIKDLFAVEGTPTTWGAEPYKDQTFDETATIVKKLDTAGAVLVAKLSMGALAMGDLWYDGRTKNPWNLEKGSSGSSAGSASATAAGLVAFAIGTETWGSIVSPSTRCGVTGLRPSFGMVSRSGAMALSWSMDKIGPLCRSALDCAMVLEAIKGEDISDNSSREVAFNYNAKPDLKKLRVGYITSQFNEDYESKANDQNTLAVLRSLGVTLHPLELPKDIPVDALSLILSAEAAAAFDELTRSDRDSLLTDQSKNAWPSIFRAARFIPAVEYINASRLRQELINEYHKLTRDFDVIVAPTYGGNQLLMTNLTGHPCVVIPNGFYDNSPTSITFLGKLYGETPVIALAQAVQDATEWEEKIPPLFK